MGSLLDGLIAWSIRNRRVVLSGALALALAGSWLATRARLDVLPDFTPPLVVVQTEAPGLSALDVEQLVTRPLERALLGTPQVNIVRSASSAGLSAITLVFEDDAEIYRARQLVSERLQSAAGRLPHAARMPQIAPITAPIGALLRLFVVPATSNRPDALRELRTFVDWTVRPRLLSIPGVSQVFALGGGVERIEVRPDPVRLRQRGVSLPELRDAVARSQSLVAAGFIESAETRTDVQAGGRLDFRNLDPLREAVIETRNETPVRIGDVATVVFGEEPLVGAASYDDHPAVFVQVNKLPWADTITTTARVEAVLRDLTRELPNGARFEPPVFRQASFVATSLRAVGRAMAIGSVLVVCVLVLFLRSWRLAVISLTAIPLSILAAAGVLIAAGATINGMTLGGLAIAVGEVVDDAIVDVENVWRRLRENARSDHPSSPLQIVQSASREIRGSVVYATVIVALVLVPVLSLGGVAGRIFSPLARAYILAILASLVVALTVTPALCAALLPRIATPDAKPAAFSLWLIERYRRLLDRVVARPRAVLAGVLVLLVAAGAAVPRLGGRFLPEFRERSLIAHVHAAPGTSLAETVRLASLVTSQLRPAVVEHVGARAGRGELDEDAAPVNRVELDLILPPDAHKDPESLGFDVASRIARIPGLSFIVEGFLGERIHEVLAGETAPVVVRVLGPDLERLRALAANVSRVMTSTPGLTRVRGESQVDVSQIQIQPDSTALARFGVSPASLLDEIETWRQGRAMTQVLAESGRVVDVVVVGTPESRDRQSLLDLPVSVAGGGVVALSVLARLADVPGPLIINHENGERRINIGADARGAGLSGAVAALRTKLAELTIPGGYRVEVGGEATERSAAGLRLVVVGGVILVSIFVLLASAFSSVPDAGIVLLNLPLGLVGGIGAALLSPEGLSVAGLVGFVTLFGIISRNGIMLVAHKRHLDDELPDLDAVARIKLAAEERLLPILMTAATAGLGLLPLALSFGAAGSELESPMALIVCGGLVTSTALNMLVLPTLYVWLARRSAVRHREPVGSSS